jgi:hypothetical protein
VHTNLASSHIKLPAVLPKRSVARAQPIRRVFNREAVQALLLVNKGDTL